MVSVIGVVPYTPEVRDDTRGLSLPLALTDQRTIILLADVSDSISHVPGSRESDMHNRCTNSGLQIFLHIVVPARDHDARDALASVSDGSDGVSNGAQRTKSPQFQKLRHPHVARALLVVLC